MCLNIFMYGFYMTSSLHVNCNVYKIYHIIIVECDNKALFYFNTYESTLHE